MPLSASPRRLQSQRYEARHRYPQRAPVGLYRRQRGHQARRHRSRRRRAPCPRSRARHRCAGRAGDRPADQQPLAVGRHHHGRPATGRPCWAGPHPVPALVRHLRPHLHHPGRTAGRRPGPGHRPGPDGRPVQGDRGRVPPHRPASHRSRLPGLRLRVDRPELGPTGPDAPGHPPDRPVDGPGGGGRLHRRLLRLPARRPGRTDLGLPHGRHQGVACRREALPPRMDRPGVHRRGAARPDPSHTLLGEP